jgi:hypothetical protein
MPLPALSRATQRRRDDDATRPLERRRLLARRTPDDIASYSLSELGHSDLRSLATAAPHRANLPRRNTYASVENTHVWPTAWADVINGGLTPQAAVEKAFKRVEEIFAKYPIAQS